MPQETNTSGPLAAPDTEGRDILFFDGVCGLCNASVDFVVDKDKRGQFLFAPLQGETARQWLPPEDIQQLKTLVLQTPTATYRRSAAVARMLWRLPGVWPVLGVLLWLIPWPIRDLGYRVISANRIRWFGQKETCRLPTPEERDRFLP